MKPGARARPRRLRASSPAQLVPTGSLSQFIFPQLVPPLPKRPLFLFSHGGHDKLEGQGGIMYRAHSSKSSAFSLTAPSHDAAEQSTAASAEPFCFHSQRMTLSSFPCSNSIAIHSRFLQGQIRNPLVFATALFTVVAHVLQRLAFEWLALRVSD